MSSEILRCLKRERDIGRKTVLSDDKTAFKCTPALIDRFTFFRSATWPLNGSEAGGDLVLIHVSLLFHVNQVVLKLSNSNWTEWSTIQRGITQVISKSDEAKREVEVQLITN